MAPDVTITDDPGSSRIEATVDGQPAGFLAYERHGDTVDLIHTDVEGRFEHHGVGSALVRAALDDARARRLTVIATCPFVRRYIREHPAYADLLVHKAG